MREALLSEMTMIIRRSQTHTTVYLQSPSSYPLSLLHGPAPEPLGPQVTRTFPREGGFRELMLEHSLLPLPPDTPLAPSNGGWQPDRDSESRDRIRPGSSGASITADILARVNYTHCCNKHLSSFTRYRCISYFPLGKAIKTTGVGGLRAALHSHSVSQEPCIWGSAVP